MTRSRLASKLLRHFALVVAAFLATILPTGPVHAVLIVNSPPIADAGGPYVIEPGASLLVNGSLSGDPNLADGDTLTYRWDLLDDGIFDVTDTPSPHFIFPWEFLLGIGMSEGNTYPLRLLVVDSAGATAGALGTVAVVAPQTDTSVQAVPEPGSAVLLLTGFALVVAFARTRRTVRGESVASPLRLARSSGLIIGSVRTNTSQNELAVMPGHVE